VIYKVLFFLSLIALSFSASSSSYNYRGTYCGNSADMCFAYLQSIQKDGAHTVTSYFIYSTKKYEDGSIKYIKTSWMAYGNQQRYGQFDRVTSNNDADCKDSPTCFALAKFDCTSQNKTIAAFQFNSPEDFSYSCDTPVDPVKQCEEQVIQQCSSNLGFASSSYEDDGNGNQTCSGTCNDGTAATEPEECTLFNNYCDEPQDDSVIVGNTGTSVLPPTTGTPDPTTDTGYTPDGTADPTAPLSALQGDTLINEVIKSRNKNEKVLVDNTVSTNQTIVEKTDDVAQAILDSGNSTIDAINAQAPFYDGNIVDAINNLSGVGSGSAAENPMDGITYTPQSLGDVQTPLHTLFNAQAISDIDAQTLVKQGQVSELLTATKNNLMSYFSVNATSSYSVENLTLAGGWGTHNISISRFAENYLSLKSIIIMLATLGAFFIILGGVKS